MSLLEELDQVDVSPLMAQDGANDPIVYAVLGEWHLSWRWYLTELDPDDGRAFGLVSGLEREYGYFYLHELEEEDIKILSIPLEQLSKVEEESC